MYKTMVIIVSIIILLAIIFAFTANVENECLYYKLNPGGMDIIYSCEVGLLVNGNISYSEFLAKYYNTTVRPIWAKIHVLGVYKCGEVFVINGRNCVFETDTSKAVFRVIVEEVIEGNTSLEGKQIIVYVDFERITGNTIAFPDFLRPVLPCRTYIAMLLPAKIWVSGRFRCSNKEVIYGGLNIKVYKVVGYTVFLYKDGMVYHLNFARNLGEVDNVYSGLDGEEYRGNERILSTPLPYDEFVEELKIVIEEAKEFSRQP
ncbi:hypothetical protein J4526_07815 [Desulfurococcaceae archaeon MEX13E-LK6-19]|nr:hypothetical protein J4526_07815 [Desulfurococcaceae archaeon MEX13E-LK6-19]